MGDAEEDKRRRRRRIRRRTLTLGTNHIFSILHIVFGSRALWYPKTGSGNLWRRSRWVGLGLGEGFGQVCVQDQFGRADEGCREVLVRV